jgi:hypothetical protein
MPPARATAPTTTTTSGMSIDFIETAALRGILCSCCPRPVIGNRAGRCGTRIDHAAPGIVNGHRRPKGNQFVPRYVVR